MFIPKQNFTRMYRTGYAQLTDRQKHIRAEKFTVFSQIESLRRIQEPSDEVKNQIETLYTEYSKQPDIVFCVRISVYADDSKLFDQVNYWSSQEDYIADALIRFSDNNPHARKAIANGEWKVKAQVIEIQEHDVNR